MHGAYIELRRPLMAALILYVACASIVLKMIVLKCISFLSNLLQRQPFCGDHS